MCGLAPLNPRHRSRVWQVREVKLVFIAANRDLPPDFHEAVIICDGGGKGCIRAEAGEFGRVCKTAPPEKAHVGGVGGGPEREGGATDQKLFGGAPGESGYSAVGGLVK